MFPLCSFIQIEFKMVFFIFIYQCSQLNQDTIIFESCEIIVFNTNTRLELKTFNYIKTTLGAQSNELIS